ncbi:MAG TPA: hypothetical protein PLO53_07330 [Candidatus Hydrogenedentes bacterium]|nr:hypothetical protein [Candidatus Hydrogenedentota bacterium]
MKYALIAVLAAGSFIGSLVGALALSGHLNSDSLSRIFGGAPPKEAASETAKQADMAADPVRISSLDTLSRQLREKEAALNQREEELKQREAQLATREAELAKLRADLETMQKQLESSLQNADTERQVRLKTIALTISEMKPDKAAERLEGLDPADIAEILLQVEGKNRGKIMEALSPETAVSVMRQLQGKRL